MKRISARYLVENYSTDELWNLLYGQFCLVFDDGELITNARETLFSSYSWDFHRMFPRTPLQVKHHIQHLLQGKRLMVGSNLDLFGLAHWSVYDTYYPENLVTRDQLSRLFMRFNNRMYNDLTVRTEEWVGSMDILDFIEVVEDPEIKEVCATAQPNEQSIAHSYEVVTNILMTPGRLPDNRVALATQSKLVNINQVLQCVAHRGFGEDISGHIFSKPIMTNFVRGIRSAYDSLIEAKMAGRSLYYAEEPLQQAEFFSRRLQLVCQTVRNLHEGDCGSTHYLDWTIKNKKDLNRVVGKFYLSEKGIKPITTEDQNLIGKKIRLRSVLHCAHPDPYGICSTCFGELALSVPTGSNIGHMCCTSMNQKISQTVLSTKHVTTSSMAEKIEIGAEVGEYLGVSKDGHSYVLSEHTRGHHTYLVVPQKAVPNLSDAHEASDVTLRHMSRVMKIGRIGMKVVDKSGHLLREAGMQISVQRRAATMSMELLQYLRTHGWMVDDLGNYLIDLKDWDHQHLLFSLPHMHANMSDHAKAIANLLESDKKQVKVRDTQVNPDMLLVDLYDLVNRRLDVQLAVLEVVLYGGMIVSAAGRDYSLPKQHTDWGVGVMTNTMAHRSLGATMAWQFHLEIVTSPMTYNAVNRPDHPLDAILLPRQVATYEKVVKQAQERGIAPWEVAASFGASTSWMDSVTTTTPASYKLVNAPDQTVGLPKTDKAYEKTVAQARDKGLMPHHITTSIETTPM